MSILTFTVIFLSSLLIFNTVSSFTPEEEAVFEKAQKSLAANQNESSIGSNFFQTANRTAGLALSNTYSYYDTSGYFHVTGEVLNRSPDAMLNIAAVAAFYDSNKNLVGTIIPDTPILR